MTDAKKAKVGTVAGSRELMAQRISSAAKGEVIVYSTDEFRRDAGAWKAARDACDAGLVTLLMRRAGDRIERIAVRR